MAKGKNTSGLGRAIINSKSKASRDSQHSNLYTTEVEDASKLKSITQENDLNEFLNTARLAGTDFTAEKQNVTVVQPNREGSIARNRFLLTPLEESESLARQAQYKSRLRVPRRPPWNKSMSSEELERSERDAFLEWRRQLAELDDADEFVMTPFERNLEVWRQLWRVMERSDLVVQIVDARNPLRFWCEDLDHYVQDLNFGDRAEGMERKSILLVNKADYLTSSQRKDWADYFDANHVKYAFYSALNASLLQEKLASQEASDKVAFAKGPDLLDAVDIEQSNPDSIQEASSDELTRHDLTRVDAENDLDHRTRILSVSELEEFFKVAYTTHLEHSSPLTVGFVGYPNVGKSSTINSLVGAKKVSVSSTPGKTKHFQTINLSREIVICDCPGLVFPQFALTKSELVCDGVLPIDQLREFTGPISIVVQRIPKEILALTYGLTFLSRQTITAENFLSAYAIARGFTRSGQGNPDESRAARYILKDFVNGKLLFCHPPPGSSQDKFNLRTREAILSALIVSKKKVAPVTRVPQTSDTYIFQSTSGDTLGETGELQSRVLDENFFETTSNLSPRPFIQGSKQHGQPFSRAPTLPRQPVSAENDLLSSGNARDGLGESDLHDRSSSGKKHFKGMKRAKQRSGKGYD